MYICPVCGYDELDELPYDDGTPSMDICDCCGFQFGVTDYDEHISFEEWRQRWIAIGMPWGNDEIEKPENWNPREQLQNLSDANKM